MLPIILISLATLLFLPGRAYFAKGQWALLYLPVIVFIASRYGVKASVLTAVLAFFTWNYFFLPPFHTLFIDDPKDLLSLLVFLLVGIVVGLQTAKLKEKEAAQARLDALREADKLKSNFISSVSHELKTPLASVMATVTNLLEKDIAWNETEARGELESVRSDLDRLNTSIGSLIDFSRLESDSWQSKKAWYGVGEILGSTLAAFPEKRRQRVEIDLPNELPQMKADFVQLSRVFQTLLENALVYSGEKSKVRVGAQDNGDRLKIWVQDEGPGIPEAELTAVFKKFYRGAAAEKFPSGVGLGLAIAAEIIKSHQGKIWAENIKPHGARIVIILPKEGIK